MLSGSCGVRDYSPCAGNPPVPPPFRHRQWHGKSCSQAAVVPSCTGDRLQQKLKLLTVHCWGFVPPCSAVRGYRRLGEICCLHLQGRSEEGGSEWPHFPQTSISRVAHSRLILFAHEYWNVTVGCAPPCIIWSHCDCPHCDHEAGNRVSDRNTAVHTPDYTASQTENHILNNNSFKYVYFYSIYYLYF